MLSIASTSPWLDGRTGRGVAIAVVDSGINPGHPHIGSVRGGVAILGGAPDADWVDRLGHGTAVAAAIHEKAPNADLYAVRVFDRMLSTGTDTLVRAILWASEQGHRLINLSLGTAREESTEPLRSAVARAAEKGSVIVSAAAYHGVRWLPGSLEGVIGVSLDMACPRESVRLDDNAERPALFASAYPRPIPGVPPERNLHGISFAVANVTGLLARVMEARSDLANASAVLAALREIAVPDGLASTGPAGIF